jgi:hypothetical protein
MVLDLLLALAATLQVPQVGQPQSAHSAPREVTYCELATNPQRFQRVRVRMTAFLESEFEHFTLNDPSCALPQESVVRVWMTYGGDVPSGAIYAPGGEGFRGPVPKPRKDAEFPLVDDRTYSNFRGFLTKHEDVTVRVTVVGTFLARSPTGDGGVRGYGHIGCCSLLVVERVEQFDDRQPRGLDHTARGAARIAAARDAEVCEVQSGRVDYGWNPSDALPLQREAEAGSRRWAFDLPERVAREMWLSTYGEAPQDLVRVKQTPGLQIFESRTGSTLRTVVVIRPGWMSYFSKTNRIAWVASWAATAICGR